MKTIALFTTTRAEFGAFIPLIKAINKSNKVNYSLFVGGAHLAQEYGHTYDEVKKEGFCVTQTFDYLLNENSMSSISKSCGINMIEMASIFELFPFDIVCLAGDRYELLPITLTAILFRKPIVHLYGGEITEGVIDDQVRNMLTKAAHLHFTSCREYATNLQKMGEESWRIHSVGELVIDNVKSVPQLSKKQIFEDVGIDPDRKTVVLTYHPATLEQKLEITKQFECIINALKKFDYQVVITAPNAEIGSDDLLNYIHAIVDNEPDFSFVYSLGIIRYYSLLPFCRFMIGNSSSGLLEAPFFKVPTVNIGPRQAGRLSHDSVINCECSESGIEDAIQKAEENDFQTMVSEMEFKLGDGFAAEKIVAILEKIKINSRLLTKKHVQDNRQ